MPLADLPLGLESLTFNLLTSATTLFEFIDDITWSYVNYM